jgi:hypothetical protein
VQLNRTVSVGRQTRLDAKCVLPIDDEVGLAEADLRSARSQP